MTIWDWGLNRKKGIYGLGFRRCGLSLTGLTLVLVIEYYVCKRIPAERVHWEYIDSGLKSTTTLAFCDSSSDFLCFGGWRGQCIGRAVWVFLEVKVCHVGSVRLFCITRYDCKGSCKARGFKVSLAKLWGLRADSAKACSASCRSNSTTASGIL